jgi:2-keto-4-pentenoate hydratase/2-oxohepta-3-ene-1,7-dioic acid hydratase in catechol pathway
LALTTRVNGEAVQQSNKSEMIFPAAELPAICWAGFTLEPGGLLLPARRGGCGELMDPKRWLVAGDIVQAEVEAIRTLGNAVVEAAS